MKCSSYYRFLFIVLIVSTIFLSQACNKSSNEKTSAEPRGFASDRVSTITPKTKAILDAALSQVGKMGQSQPVPSYGGTDMWASPARSASKAGGTAAKEILGPFCINMSSLSALPPGVNMELCYTTDLNVLPDPHPIPSPAGGTISIPDIELASMEMNMTVTLTNYVNTFPAGFLDIGGRTMTLNGVATADMKMTPGATPVDDMSVEVRSIKSSPSIAGKIDTDCSMAFSCVTIDYSLSGSGSFGSGGGRAVYTGDANVIDTRTNESQYCNMKVTLNVDTSGNATQTIECFGFTPTPGTDGEMGPPTRCSSDSCHLARNLAEYRMAMLSHGEYRITNEIITTNDEGIVTVSLIAEAVDAAGNLIVDENGFTLTYITSAGSNEDFADVALGYRSAAGYAESGSSEPSEWTWNHNNLVNLESADPDNLFVWETERTLTNGESVRANNGDVYTCRAPGGCISVERENGDLEFLGLYDFTFSDTPARFEDTVLGVMERTNDPSNPYTEYTIVPTGSTYTAPNGTTYQCTGAHCAVMVTANGSTECFGACTTVE